MSDASIAQKRTDIERWVAAAIREQVVQLAAELGRNATAAQIDAKVDEWMAKPDLQLTVDRMLAAQLEPRELN